MKVVQVLQKAWPEFTICCSSMAYLIIRIVADVNKINLPTISLFLVVFILLCRGQGERKGE